MSDKARCVVCGQRVEILGGVTKYYKGIDAMELRSLKAENEGLKDCLLTRDKCIKDYGDEIKNLKKERDEFVDASLKSTKMIQSLHKQINALRSRTTAEGIALVLGREMSRYDCFQFSGIQQVRDDLAKALENYINGGRPYDTLEGEVANAEMNINGGE